MARHVHHRCAFRALDPTGYEMPGDDYLRGVTYCGQVSYFKAPERELGAAKRASCPKCAAALGKLHLKRLGDRVRLEPAPDIIARRHKSAFSFYLDGVLRGYVASERGFGKGWELYRLAKDEREADWRGHGGPVTPDRPRSSWDADRVAEESPIHALHYGARDAMATGAVRAVAAGLLPTVEEQAEAERKRIADKAEAEQRRQAEAEQHRQASERLRAEHAEQVETATLGIETLKARPDLSNLELAGLEAALTLIKRARPA